MARRDPGWEELFDLEKGLAYNVSCGKRNTRY